MNSRCQYWLNIFMCVACAVASTACALTAWTGTETIKSFRADAGVKDVGVLKQQEGRDVTFRLTNFAELPVEITDITTSCTCTRAEVDTRNLRSGESTELSAHLNVRTLRGRVGALVNVFYRVENAQSIQRLPLTITATVEPHYTLTPENIFFEHEENPQKKLQHARITLTANEQPTVHILKTYSTHPAFQIDNISFDESTGTSTIHLVFKPELLITKSVKAEIVVRTDSEREPIHRLPVRVVSKRDN